MDFRGGVTILLVHRLHFPRCPNSVFCSSMGGDTPKLKIFMRGLAVALSTRCDILSSSSVIGQSLSMCSAAIQRYVGSSRTTSFFPLLAGRIISSLFFIFFISVR